MPLVSGAIAALFAAAAGLAVVEVLVTVLTLGDGRSTASVSQVLHVGAGLWLLAHGASLTVPDGEVTVIPLGITALSLALLFRAGRSVASRTLVQGRRGIPLVTAAIALPYALLLAGLARLDASAPGPIPSTVRSGLGSLLLAGVAAALGAARVLAPERLAFLRRGGRVLRLSGPAPGVVRIVLRAALVAVGVLLAGSALLTAISIASRLPNASELAGSTAGGVLGSTGVLVVQLALLPNLLLWFTAYATGPGFAIGSETTVRLVGGHLGEVPALPMLGGLPGPLPAPLVGAVLLVPVVAGLLAGRFVSARLPHARLWHGAAAAAAVGPVAGLLLGAGVGLASGQVLGGDLGNVGASSWRTGLAVALEIGLIGVVGSLLDRAARARWVRERRDDEVDAGAHRRRASRLRRRARRTSWRPSWLGRRPTWLGRRPTWLGRRSVRLPD